MGQTPDRALTDAELLSVFKNPQADLALLSREERARLTRLTEPSAPATNMLGQAVSMPPDVAAQWEALQARQRGEGPAIPDQLRQGVEGLANLGVEALPTIGGAVGGIVGSAGGPAGAIGGAALGGAGGEGFRQSINTLRGKETPRTTGQAVTGMGKQAAIQGGAQAAGVAVGAGMQKAGPWLMEKAVKPTQTVLDEYRTTGSDLAKTLLNEGINVTSNGLQKLQRLFGETNDEIARAVAGSDAMVSKKAVESYVPEVAARLANQVGPASDLKAVESTVEEFAKHPLYPGAEIPVAGAQALKKGTYQQIGKKYGEVSAAGIETQKALGRGLKEEIAKAVPGISALNARDSELMAAMDAVGRRVALSGRADPVGFAWVASNPTTFLAALIDRNPAIKSMLARGLYHNAASAAGVTPQLIRAAVATIASGEDAANGTSARPASQ